LQDGGDLGTASLLGPPIPEDAADAAEDFEPDGDEDEDDMGSDEGEEEEEEVSTYFCVVPSFVVQCA